MAVKTEKTHKNFLKKKEKYQARRTRSVQVNREAHAISGKITIKMAVKIGK